MISGWRARSRLETRLERSRPQVGRALHPWLFQVLRASGVRDQVSLGWRFLSCLARIFWTDKLRSRQKAVLFDRPPKLNFSRTFLVKLII